MDLAPLTVLNKQYTSRRTLDGSSPFDFKYLGERFNSDEQVIIREFFPKPLIRRKAEKTSIVVTGGDEAHAYFEEGVEYFKKESEALGQLSHKALPSAYDMFEANGTVYRVRAQHSSMPLARGLKNKGQLPEKAALMIMGPVLEALHEAHEAGLYHGGISPDTLRLLQDGSVLVTGFRSAYLQLARDLDLLDAFVQPGFSAIEQYTPRGEQGAWTDVYAVAATISTMVTGTVLPEASERLGEADPVEPIIQDADAFSSPQVRDVLLQALTVDPAKRIRSADEFRRLLERASKRYDPSEASYVVMPVKGEQGAPSEARVLSESDSNNKGSNLAMMIGVPAVLLLLGVAAWFVLADSDGIDRDCQNYTSVSIDRAHECYATFSEEEDAAIEVEIEGIVTRAYGDYIRLQDDSGDIGARGITIRRTSGGLHDAIGSEIASGTTLTVSGRLSDFNDLLQINEQNVHEYEIGDTGDAPDPLSIDLSTVTASNHDYESVLVRVEGLTIRDPAGNFTQQTSYVVEQNGTTAPLRVQRPSETELPGTAVPDVTFDYEGVVGRFHAESQLLPVQVSDLILDEE